MAEGTGGTGRGTGVTTFRILGDWGTTRMRLYRIVAGEVVDRVAGPGIGALEGRSAGAVLTEAMATWRTANGDPERIVLCGMAGARGGVAEAGYLDVPADVAAWRVAARTTIVDGLRVAVAPGLACRHTDGAPDVMRGEEAQIFGAIAVDPALGRGRRTILLPGTHSKWVAVADGRVETFRTFPVGELFGLLSRRSTMVVTPADREAPDYRADFDQGFDTALDRVGAECGPLGAMFEARAATLRDNRSPAWAEGLLSGLLIGHEVAEAVCGIFGGVDDVTLIGDPHLAALYERALGRRNISASAVDGDAAVLAGLALLAEEQGERR